MPYDCDWSEAFVDQLSDKAMRDAFVSDQVRSRIALLVRALREQPERAWSQTQLGQKMGKPQNVVSRLEDPDYGRMSLSTLLEVASAFDLPLWVDIPEWSDWFARIKATPDSKTARASFDADGLKSKARQAEQLVGSADVVSFADFALRQNGRPATIATSVLGISQHPIDPLNFGLSQTEVALG